MPKRNYKVIVKREFPNFYNKILPNKKKLLVNLEAAK